MQYFFCCVFFFLKLDDNKDGSKDKDKDRANSKDSVQHRNKDSCNIDTRDSSVTLVNNARDVHVTSSDSVGKIVTVSDGDRTETSSTVSTLSSQSVEQSSPLEDKRSEVKSPPTSVNMAATGGSFGAMSGQEKPSDL